MALGLFKHSGNSDIQKIKSLANKFSGLASQHTKGYPAFKENSGSNPHDVPWMIQSLLQKDGILKKFHTDLSQRLALGYPVPMDLYFLNPSFASAAVKWLC